MITYDSGTMVLMGHSKQICDFYDVIISIYLL